MATLGVVMRFKDSMGTLPVVLEALYAQTRRPDLLVAVDNASGDGSRQELQRRGARFVDWDRPYEVSKVVNAGIAACDTDLVLMLSSHTVLANRDALESFERALAVDRVAAVSYRHPAFERFPGPVTWADLVERGLTRFSPYNNSSGCLRRERWVERPFDERIPWGVEDYDWMVDQLRMGYGCSLVPVDRRYLRAKTPPWQNLKTARMLHAIAARYGLRTRFDDLRIGTGVWWTLKTAGCSVQARNFLGHQLQWWWGRATWRRHDPFRVVAGSAP
jgi:glycosyltransferase involved in cell wall biosynthesis